MGLLGPLANLGWLFAPVGLLVQLAVLRACVCQLVVVQGCLVCGLACYCLCPVSAPFGRRFSFIVWLPPVCASGLVGGFLFMLVCLLCVWLTWFRPGPGGYSCSPSSLPVRLARLVVSCLSLFSLPLVVCWRLSPSSVCLPVD